MTSEASSSIGSIASTRRQVELQDVAHPPCITNGPFSPPEIAAELAGSWSWMKTPRGRSASGDAHQRRGRPTPWRTRSRGRRLLPDLIGRTCPGAAMMGLLNWSVACARLGGDLGRPRPHAGDVLGRHAARPSTDSDHLDVAAERARMSRIRLREASRRSRSWRRKPSRGRRTPATAWCCRPCTRRASSRRTSPSACAPSTIASASRSFIDPVGLTYSSLIQISAPPSGTTWRSRTSGVPDLVEDAVARHALWWGCRGSARRR